VNFDLFFILFDQHRDTSGLKDATADYKEAGTVDALDRFVRALGLFEPLRRTLFARRTSSRSRKTKPGTI